MGDFCLGLGLSPGFLGLRFLGLRSRRKPQTRQDCVFLGLKKREPVKFVGRDESGYVTVVKNIKHV